MGIRSKTSLAYPQTFLSVGISSKTSLAYPQTFHSVGIRSQTSLAYPQTFHSVGISSKTSFTYPQTFLNYYPCQGQSALSMPNFNEASLSDTLQLVYSYKILWETGSLIPFYIGHYYNNQSSHQWLLLLRKKLPISLI